MRHVSTDGLELYLSNDRERTFHPKIYAFREGAGSSVFVGSANLTFGGLAENYEASIRSDESDGHLAAAVAPSVTIDVRSFVVNI